MPVSFVITSVKSEFPTKVGNPGGWAQSRVPRVRQLANRSATYRTPSFFVSSSFFPWLFFPPLFLNDRRCFRTRATVLFEINRPEGNASGAGNGRATWTVSNRKRFVRTNAIRKKHLLATLRFEDEGLGVRKKGSSWKSADSTSRHVALFMHHQPLGIRRFNGGNNVIDVVSIKVVLIGLIKRSSREQTAPSITMIYSVEKKKRERWFVWIIGATAVDDRCDNFLFIA